MRLNTLIIVALALLPSHLCIGMDDLPFNIERTQYKKYHRYLVQKKLTPEIHLQIVESYMEITDSPGLYETLPSNHSIKKAEDKFEKAFGYILPTHWSDYKKTDCKTFITHNKKINPIEAFAPQNSLTWKIEEIKNNVSELLKHKEHEDIQLLLEEMAAKKKAIRTLESENKKLQREKQMHIEIAKQDALLKSKRELEERNLRMDAAKKRDKELNKAHNKSKSKQRAPRHEKSLFKQLEDVKADLRKRNNCNTPAQLNTALYNYCKDNDMPCTREQINNNIAWHYDKTRGLMMLIGKAINHYDCDFCFPSNSCDCCGQQLHAESSDQCPHQA